MPDASVPVRRLDKYFESLAELRASFDRGEHIAVSSPELGCVYADGLFGTSGPGYRDPAGGCWTAEVLVEGGRITKILRGRERGVPAQDTLDPEAPGTAELRDRIIAIAQQCPAILQVRNLSWLFALGIPRNTFDTLPLWNGWVALDEAREAAAGLRVAA